MTHAWAFPWHDRTDDREGFGHSQGHQHIGEIRMRVIDTSAGTRVAASTVSTLNGRRRLNLGRVVDLARIYRDCDLKVLAKDLGRDPTRLIPETGNPKVDLLAGLARVLEWPMTEVVRAVRGEIGPETPFDPELRTDSVAELDARCVREQKAGRYDAMLSSARALHHFARTPIEHAMACHRLGIACAALGNHRAALEHLHEGNRCPGIDNEVLKISLLTHLAKAHYALWNLVEARTIATEAINQTAPENRRTRSLLAMAHAICGQAVRRSLGRQPLGQDRLATKAIDDLAVARGQYLELAERFGGPAWTAHARTCLGGIIEMEASLGSTPPVLAIARLTLEETSDACNEALESQGWWLVFGSNVLVRHVHAHALVDGLEPLGEKLGPIAERLDHWSFRAKAFSIELERRDQARRHRIEMPPWTLGPRAVRTLVHTMGRIPPFRAQGWRILTDHGVLDQAVKTLPRCWKRR